jgi:NAD kinase
MSVSVSYAAVFETLSPQSLYLIDGSEVLLMDLLGMQVRGVHITLRMRLECMVMRKGKQLIPPVEVLNEVVVDRGSNPFLTKIECWEHNRLLTKVRYS